MGMRLILGQYGLLILIHIIGYGSTIDLQIESNSEPVMLHPLTGQQNVNTRWNLTACEDCKLVMRCAFNRHVHYCPEGSVTVNTGGQIFELCSQNAPVFLNVSLNNNMFVTIMNVGQRPVVYCTVVATRSYLNQAQPEIDSSEYGLRAIRGNQEPSCPCGWSNRNRQRIVNGFETSLHEYPFIVQLMRLTDSFRYCGGSILTSRHILTAAHCTQGLRPLQIGVFIGEHDTSIMQETDATRMIRAIGIQEHPEYNVNTHANDIALLVLEVAIQFTNHVGPVCLPARREDLIGQYVKVIGWGLTDDQSLGGQASAILRKVYTRVVHSDICEKIYPLYQPAGSLCIYNDIRSPCSGDSGGPLIKLNPNTNRYVQIALVSYGKLCGSTDPNVVVEISQYLRWIQLTIAASQIPAAMCF